MKAHLSKFTWILPVLSGIFFGSVGVFTRTFATVGFNSHTVVAVRMLGTTILMTIGLAVLKRSLFHIRKRDIWLFVAGGIIMMSTNVTYNAAITLLSLSFAAVLAALAPTFVLFVSALLFKEKITPQKLFCVCLALVGCVFVSGLIEEGIGTALSLTGTALGVLSAVCYGMYGLCSKQANQLHYHGLTVTYYCTMIGAAALAPFADWHQVGSFLMQAPALHLGYFILHSLISSLLPYLLYTLAVNYMELGKVTIFASVDTVAATILGAFLYREVPSLTAVLGIILTVTAVILLSLPQETLHQLRGRLQHAH